MKPSTRLGAILVLLTSTQLFAQDQCVALLKHGIYDTVRSEQLGSSASTVYNQLCSNYSSYKAGTLKADASGRYGLISGSASFSKEEVEAVGSSMCQTGYSDSQAASQITNFSSVVSPAGLKSFDNCIRNSQAGLIVNTDFDEAAPELVTISARFSPIGPARTSKVTGIQIEDSSIDSKYKVSCSGPLSDAAQRHSPITSAVLAMSCKRPMENNPANSFPLAGKPGGLAYPAKVSVSTEVGTIQFLWGPIYLPPPVSPIPPAFVGEIKAVAFQSGDPAYASIVANSWIECDGRALNAGDYPELYKALGNTWGTTNLGTTFKIPDLRGQFLRGWNHGSNIDPEANQRGPADPGNPHAGWTGSSGDAVGSRQADALAVHHHEIDGQHLEASGGSGFNGTGLDSNSSHNGGWQKHTNTLNAGSSPETRPKNVAVMYVIYAGKK